MKHFYQTFRGEIVRYGLWDRVMVVSEAAALSSLLALAGCALLLIKPQELLGTALIAFVIAALFGALAAYLARLNYETWHDRRRETEQSDEPPTEEYALQDEYAA